MMMAAARADAEPLSLARVALLLGLVSDTARMDILLALADGPMHLAGLAEAVRLSPAAASARVAAMRLAGLIEVRRTGRSKSYGPTEAGARVAGWARGLRPRVGRPSGTRP